MEPRPEILESVEALHGASIEERALAASDLAAQLGAAWSASPPLPREDSLPLRHGPTGLDFVATPGGVFRMGLTDEDITDASRYVDFTAQVARWVEREAKKTRPVRRVVVRPFLCARRVLSAADVARLGGPRSAEEATWGEARDLARSLGFRLPSEAELEWLARDGGTTAFTLDAARRREEIGGDEHLLRSRFGVHDLWRGEWAEDGWHPTYEGAPGVSAPWAGGEPIGVVRGDLRLRAPQSDEGLLGALAALRREGRERSCSRLAMEL